MDLVWYSYLLIIAAGFASGFINTLASSGSVISLSLLIFLGVPATVANGSNRVAILFQALVGTRGYQQKGLLTRGYAPWLAASATVGAVLGAMIASDLNEAAMERVIGGVMILILILLLVNPKRWILGRPEIIKPRPNWKEVVAFFFIGIYGGFIQAGVGNFILAALVLGAGFSLLKANALKLLIIAIYLVPALLVFVYNGQVDWLIGLFLALGNGSGAWVATRLADRPNIGTWAHRMLIVVVLYSAVRLLGIF